jgi:hypothetical protein
MTDITAQAEAILKTAGYGTWQRHERAEITLGFEDESSIGFLYVFDTANALLSTYKSREEATLAAYTSALRSAGDKAWNVYSVFLTAEESKPDVERRVLRIEENLRRTRKIARASVRSERALEVALLPLLPLIARRESKPSDYSDRLERKIANANGRAVARAFFGAASSDEIARMLQDG